MLKIAIFFLLISSNILGQSNTDQVTKISNNNNEWKKFDQPDYSVTYPPTWELDNSEAMGTKFILYSPIESATDKFKDNVNLIITGSGR